MRVPKRKGRASTTSSVVNSYVSSDIQPRTLSRSSSVSFDNPSIDDSSLNDENQVSHGKPIPTEAFLPLPSTPGLSSSLSELDPMLNGRPRTPSPEPPPLVDEPILLIPVYETLSPIETVEHSAVTENNQSPIPVPDSTDTSDPTVLPSPSTSIDQGLLNLSIEKKNDDLLQSSPEDTLQLS